MRFQPTDRATTYVHCGAISCPKSVKNGGPIKSRIYQWILDNEETLDANSKRLKDVKYHRGLCCKPCLSKFHRIRKLNAGSNMKDKPLERGTKRKHNDIDVSSTDAADEIQNNDTSIITPNVTQSLATIDDDSSPCPENSNIVYDHQDGVQHHVTDSNSCEQSISTTIKQSVS